VPEASIDEDGDLRAREDDVGAPTPSVNGCAIDEVPQATPV
jgi:hypothetical protein